MQRFESFVQAEIKILMRKVHIYIHNKM